MSINCTSYSPNVNILSFSGLFHASNSTYEQKYNSKNHQKAANLFRIAHVNNCTILLPLCQQFIAFSHVTGSKTMQYHVHNRMRFISDSERDFAWLVSELWLRVLNAAPSENRWWRFTANQRTGFTDEMCMRIAWDISPSPNVSIVSTSPAEFSPPISAFMELRINANLPCLVSLALNG